MQHSCSGFTGMEGLVLTVTDYFDTIRAELPLIK
jgi:hypothetical protein